MQSDVLEFQTFSLLSSPFSLLLPDAFRGEEVGWRVRRVLKMHQAEQAQWHISLQFQCSGGRGRGIAASSRPAWATE